MRTLLHIYNQGFVIVCWNICNVHLFEPSLRYQTRIWLCLNELSMLDNPLSYMFLSLRLELHNAVLNTGTNSKLQDG